MFLTKINSKFLRLLNLDSHTAQTLALRLWSVGAGLVNLALIPLFLGPVEQGYYYTYGSIIALQIFFELGFNQVITQFTSHEVAHLDLSQPDKKSVYYKRLASLISLFKRWYALIATAFILVVGGAGIAFFRHTGSLPTNQWIVSWVILVVASGGNLLLSPWLACLEGCGRIDVVAKMRFFQSLFGYGILWIMLICGFGLNAVPAIPVVSFLYSYWWLRKQTSMLRSLAHEAQQSDFAIDWKTEILPLQWRISLSWISSYLIFNLFTPLVFARAGERQAGQLGMSLSVFTAITSIGMSWINAKAPALSMNVSRKNFAGLNAVFWPAAFRSTLAVLFASLAFICLSAYLRSYYELLENRLLPTKYLFCLALISISNSAVFAAAIYMRAFKKEPMLAVSVWTGILSAAALYGGSYIGFNVMLYLYSATILFVCLPWTAWIFTGLYKRS